MPDPKTAKPTVQHTRMATKDLRHPEKNPRKISRSRLEDLKRSIKADPDFLEVRRVVVNSFKGREGVIIGGNQRFEALKALGVKEIPVTVVCVPPEKEREWIVKDNAHHGETDPDMLAEMVLQDMENMQNALPSDEIDHIIDTFGPGADGKEEEEQAEDIAKGKHITKPGDVWVLGEHILVCGDSTDPDTLKTLLAGTKADMAFTDPPYNVDYGNHGNKRWGKDRKIANDKMDGAKWQAFTDAWMANLNAGVRGATYICMSCKEWPTVQQAFVRHGFRWSTTIIWVKDRFTLGRSDYQRQHEPILKGEPSKKDKNPVQEAPMEPILYGAPAGGTREWNGGRDEGDAWFFKRPGTNPIHPTMKPVELVVRAIINSSNKAGTVLDIFGGGGSTLIACEKTGRRARVVELDPGFCDAIIARYVGHTQDTKVFRNGKPHTWEGPVINLSGPHG